MTKNAAFLRSSASMSEMFWLNPVGLLGQVEHHLAPVHAEVLQAAVLGVVAVERALERCRVDPREVRAHKAASRL